MSNQGNDHGGPVRYLHPERLASRCHHRLHPSSPRYPYCMRCILSKAKGKLSEAHLWFQKRGGLSAPADARDRTWHRARLVHKLAERQIGRATRLHTAHKQRILDWDTSHEQAGIEPTYEGWSTDNDRVCPVCFSKALEELNEERLSKHGCALVDKSKAWWEKSGKLVPDEGPSSDRSISPEHLKSRQGKKPIKEKHKHLGPSPMAGIILQCRIDLRMQKEAEREPSMAEKAELSFRRKYNCFDMKIDPATWSEPQPYCRMKPIPEPRPRRQFIRTPSKLSQVVSVDDFEVSEETLQREEEERMQRAERRARKEVGCLFLVGKSEQELAMEVGVDFFFEYRSAVRPNSGPSDALPMLSDSNGITDADAGPGDNDEIPDLTDGGEEGDMAGGDQILDEDLYNEFLNLDTSSEDSEESAPEEMEGVSMTGGFGS